EVVVPQDGLETAVAAVMTELGASHVERRDAGRHPRGVVDEDELSIRVDGTPDEPGTRRPVDVDAPAGGPSHAVASIPPASASTARRASAASGGGKKSRARMARRSRRRRRNVRRREETVDEPAASA